MLVSTFKKINSLLDKGQRIKVVILMFMILISGLLETIGVSLIVPLISAILDKESFAQNKYVKVVCETFGIQDMDKFILMLIGGLILIYIGKNIYLVFCTYIQARFVNHNRCRVSRNLLSQYLHRPYEYYFHADSATILRTIYGDMDNVFNLMMHCLNFVAEAIICVCLCLVLLVIDVKMCIFMVALLGSTTWFISGVLKPKLNRVGEDSRIELANIYKGILQPVAGIKDVKVLHKEDFFLDTYEDSARKYAKHQIKNNVLSIIPRQLIETIAIVGILAYVGISILVGVDMGVLLGLVGAFGVAAMRLLPSVNRLNTYIANISFFESALNNIYENIDMTAVRKQEEEDKYNREHKNELPIHLTQKIELENISYRYPETDKDIFKDAHMVIPVGKSVGVVGPSGSGKTTIIDVLLGLLQLDEGRILSDGVNIFDNYGAWLSHIGYIPQTIYMIDDSIRNNIAFGVPENEIRDERIWEVLEEAQLKEFVEELPERLDAQIGERGVRISGGQRQRLGIARALYHNPELLVFDEATSALDNDTETAIMEAIDKLHGQKTMVIIAHRLRTLENCDMIYEVRDGKITQTK